MEDPNYKGESQGRKSSHPGPPVQAAAGRAAGRLAAVTALVPVGSRVADVGSGHGLLCRHLLASGRARHCIATERTERLAAGIDLGRPTGSGAAPLERRWGDGLAPIAPEDRIDVVILAGLGGPSILAILEASPIPLGRFRRLVLQPQTDVGRLRRRLVERELTIADERLVRERGRFYVVLALEPGAGPDPAEVRGLDPEDLLEAGPQLVRRSDPLLGAYWTRQLERLEAIRERAGGTAPRPGIAREISRARRILDSLG